MDDATKTILLNLCQLIAESRKKEQSILNEIRFGQKFRELENKIHGIEGTGK